MTKAELYSNYLRDEGYQPKIDGDGDVVFKAQSLTYILFADEDDREYYRLTIPNFWPIESEKERAQAYAAAGKATAQMKVAKVSVVKDNLWASVEMLIDPIENFTKVFERSLRILQASVEVFRDEMNAAR